MSKYYNEKVTISLELGNEHISALLGIHALLRVIEDKSQSPSHSTLIFQLPETFRYLNDCLREICGDAPILMEMWTPFDRAVIEGVVNGIALAYEKNPIADD